MRKDLVDLHVSNLKLLRVQPLLLSAKVWLLKTSCLRHLLPIVGHFHTFPVHICHKPALWGRGQSYTHQLSILMEIEQPFHLKYFSQSCSSTFFCFSVRLLLAKLRFLSRFTLPMKWNESVCQIFYGETSNIPVFWAFVIMTKAEYTFTPLDNPP